jgi:hypothetical protein
MSRFIEECQSRFRWNGLFSGRDGCIANKIKGRANDIVLGLDQNFGSSHGLGKESLVQESKFVSVNATAQCKHEFKDIVTSHEMDVFINAMRNAAALVETAIWIGAPSVVALNAVDALGQIHPFVLGICDGLKLL